MADKIRYPDADSPSTNEWRVFIDDLEAFTGGLLLIDVGNIDTTDVPTILAGGRIDINGQKYKTGPTEHIGGDPVNNQQNYIYAVADGDTALFLYSADEPQWDPVKGGWYSGHNRAIVKFFRCAYSSHESYSDFYSNKVILDSYNAKFAINTKQPIPNFGGVNVYGSPNEWAGLAEPNLLPGMYRYDLRGGSSGIGGATGLTAGPSPVSATPSSPTLGDRKVGTFIHCGGSIQVKVGNDGGDGGAGGEGGYNNSNGRAFGGRGGGGGSGIESRIGGIIAEGGAAGIGGDAIATTISGINNYPDHGGNGGYGIGGNGSKGADGEYSSSSGNYTPTVGKPGGKGSPPKPSSSGYANIWRVG